MSTTASKLTLASSNGTPVTTATSTDVVAAPATGFHVRVYRIFASNTSATACKVSWRDGAAGTIYYPMALGQNGNFDLPLDKPLELTTATKLVLVTSAAGSVEYTVQYQVVPD